MMFASPTLRPVIAPARWPGLPALDLCVPPAVSTVADSPVEDNAALLGGGPGAVLGDRSSQESARPISRTGGAGIGGARRRDTPNAQEVA
jgi:hypothetical protein